MSTKLLMSVEEYLRTSFEDGDRDYVDGEVEERSVGTGAHSFLQIWLGSYFLNLGLHARTELRTNISASRYRVADVSVWPRHQRPGLGIPQHPPMLTIEILSPEDRLTRVLPRIQDFLAAGVSTVWVIDPEERKALQFTQSDKAGSLTNVLTLPEEGIALDLDFLFQTLEERA
jgi:Uma2 family endonuclease